MSDSTVKKNDTAAQEASAATWSVNGQQRETILSGFYVVGPVGGSCAAYVAHLDHARLIADAPELFDTLKQFALWADTMVMLHDDQKVCGIEVRHFRRAAKICNALIAGTSEQCSTASDGSESSQDKSA